MKQKSLRKISSKRTRKSKVQSYEKSTMVHHRYICHKFQQSPVQDKARAVIRKYKHQMKQLEFKRLQKLVPSMDEMEDPTEVIRTFCLLKKKWWIVAKMEVTSSLSKGLGMMYLLT